MNLEVIDEPEPEDDAPRLFSAWMTVIQAELMLGHLATAGASWPQAHLYCHACVTALRSVTFMLQKALRHDTGFDRWYAEVQQHLGADPESVFLNQARNYVLKESALELMMAFKFSYAGPLAMKVTSIGRTDPRCGCTAKAQRSGSPRTGAAWRASSSISRCGLVA